nr:MAG TPA: hypothetical protein [Caudoviricetes sp.]
MVILTIMFFILLCNVFRTLSEYIISIAYNFRKCKCFF